MAEPFQPRPASVLNRPVSSGLRWADRYGAASCSGNCRAEKASWPCLSVKAPRSCSSAGFAPSPADSGCTCMLAASCSGCSRGQRISRTCNDSSRACSAAPDFPASAAASRQCTVALATDSLSRLTFHGWGASEAGFSAAGLASGEEAPPIAIQLMRPCASRAAKISGALHCTDSSSATDCSGCTFLSTAARRSKRSKGAPSRSCNSAPDRLTSPVMRTTACSACSKEMCRLASSTPERGLTGAVTGT